MKPSWFLADALDKAASLIEENLADYNWYHPESCAMGYLVRAVTEKSKEEVVSLTKDLKERVYTYAAIKYLVQYNGTTDYASGYIIPEIVQVLVQAGLEKSDFVYIEELGKGATINTTAEGAVYFFKEEARKMREQLQQSVSVAQKEKIETVTQIVRGL